MALQIIDRTEFNIFKHFNNNIPYNVIVMYSIYSYVLKFKTENNKYLRMMTILVCKNVIKIIVSSMV